MKIAITGHRPNKLGNDYALTSSLILWLKEEILNKIRRINEPDRDTLLTFITGMALGIDTLFALIAIEYNILLIAAIPFRGQELKWTKKSIMLYRNIMTHHNTTEVVVCDGGYAAFKMQIRNQWMVDNCDILIAVWDGTSGGTANCVAYAKDKKKQIIYINPKDFKP